jgi:hypothetical protein
LKTRTSPLILPSAYVNKNPCILTTPPHVPTYTPSHLPTPYTPPPMSNYKHDDDDGRGLTPADHNTVKHPANYPNPSPPSSAQNGPAPSPHHYSDINVLLQDIRDRDSEAITYMAELNRYTEECGRIEMEKQKNGDGYQNVPTKPPLVNTSPPPPSPTTSTTSNDIANYPNTSPPSTYAYLETLRHDCNNGMLSAIAFMQGLREYTKACLYEQEEWEADKRAEIRKNHWIQYPKRSYNTTPRSWSALGNENGCPDTIEKSRPLYPALKRRHYKNFRAKRYPNPRSRSRSPDPKPKQRQSNKHHNTTPHTPSPPTMLDNKHHNNPPAPTPYSTSCSRPPPWPNKNPNRNHHNKPHYNSHTPAGTTTRRRPPPWPIIPSSTTILSIGDSRPPPWPNIHHHQHRQHSPVSPTPLSRPPPWPIIPYRIHSTSQNCRNAKRRIKAQSRNILDKTSF